MGKMKGNRRRSRDHRIAALQNNKSSAAVGGGARASARLFRASLEFFVTIVSFSARLSDVTPFIAVLIEAATGAEMRPCSVNVGGRYTLK